MREVWGMVESGFVSTLTNCRRDQVVWMFRRNVQTLVHS